MTASRTSKSEHHHDQQERQERQPELDRRLVDAGLDVLSELEHAGHALTMSELSRELMVSNGNITGVIDRLERDGMVSRRPSETDRRVQYIELTESGLEQFRSMAREHEDWLQQLFGELSTGEMQQLENLLREAKASIRTALAEEAS